MSRRQRRFTLASSVMLILGIAVAAWAYYTASGIGSGVASTTTISSPAVSASSPSVDDASVSWTAVLSPSNTSSENAEVTYVVERGTSATGPWSATNGTCSGTLSSTTLSCDDHPAAAGTYYYRVTATFRSWTSMGVSNSVAVVVDATPPTSSITFPTAGAFYNAVGYAAGCGTPGTDDVCGMANDPGAGASGVQKVQVAIQRSSDSKWWNGSSFVSSGSAIWNDASGTTSWTYAFSHANLDDGVTYTVASQAIDNANNVQTTPDTKAFTYDITAPATTITINPASPNGTNGWYKTTQPTFTLSATDTGGSGVASTSYQIDGGTTQTYSSAVTIPDGQHTITYWSTDNAGNVETSHTTATIKVDTVTPANVLSLGSATGAFLNGTTLYYKSDAAGSFTVVNGVTDATSGPASATFPAISTTGWVHNVETVSTPPGGPFTSSTYSWSASPTNPTSKTFTATDNAGNTNAGTAWTFTSDTTAGAPTITFPVATSYNNTSWNAGCTSAICGTASDAGSGIQKVEVSIQQGSSNYWNGSSFTSASPVWNLASGTTSWSYAFAGASFPAEGSYTVSTRMTDNVGNVSTSSSVTFTVDRTSPTISDVTISGGTAGKPEQGDTIVVTFSEHVAASSICSSWTNSGIQTITGNNTGALVTITNNAAGAGGNDQVSFQIGSGSCGGTIHIGTINLGSPNYVTATMTFGANGTNKDTQFTYDPSTKKLTVLLGQANVGTACTSTCPSSSNATTTPDSAISDIAGNTIAGTFSKNSSQF